MKTTYRPSFAGSLIVLCLLVPVPVFGLTFLGTWRFFQSTMGIATTNSTDAPNNYSLTIGMGQVPPPTGLTKLSVSAVRDFRIDSPQQWVEISHFFGTFLKNGNISVNMSIQQDGVANDPFNFPQYSFNAVGMQHPSLNYMKSGFLHLGYFRLSITITYSFDNSGNSSWNNSSPHTFNFRGF